MSEPTPGNEEWLEQVVEDVVEPDLPIVDPHHHLWPVGGTLPYGLDELHHDTGSGHRVEQTAQAPNYLHTIDAFGPERCMFESNFPVDRFSVSYPVVWNAFNKLTSGFSATERTAMFSGTARRVYRLEHDTGG
jgi:predicted TIM-barrel fold metal-dependent hydrolase